LGFTSASVVSISLALFVVSLGCIPIARAQANDKRVALAANVRPEVTAQNDRGRVADSLPMEHMLLQLRRSPEQETALQQLLHGQQRAGSSNFHRWITAQEFGARFGVAPETLAGVTSWLREQGFHVNVVYPSAMVIDFSGTAAQVRRAFQTDVHYLAAK